MHPLIKNISQRTKVNDETISLILSTFEVQQCKKGEQLLREGATCQKLYFLNQGIARSYYFYKDKDITSWFYNEGHWISSWFSFYAQQPSFEYIELLEDAELFSVNYSSFQKLLNNAQFNTFGRLLAEEQTAFIDYFSKGFSFMTAKEKYDLLLTLFPDVSQRVNLGHVASFLGITQETLSRIRAKK